MKKEAKQYEITFLASEEGLDLEAAKTIEGLEGKVEEVNNWGRRELAYPIKGCRFANYTTVVFTIAVEKLFEFDRKIKHLDDIIRHLIVEAIPKPKPSKIRAINKIVKEEKIEEKPEKRPRVKVKTIKKAEKISEAKEIQEEEESADERLKKLDEKLEEILAE